jgi:hypothetical protein
MKKSGTFYRIDAIGKGFLAVSAHPAQCGNAAMMIADMATGEVRQVVSLLQPGESRELGLVNEAALVNEHSMEFVSFPIADMGLPESINDFARLSQKLFHQVEAGINTLIHCRAGIGRSGLLVAAVLLHGGRSVQQAFTQVTQMRGCQVPETAQQGDWLLANHALITAMDDSKSGSSNR